MTKHQERIAEHLVQRMKDDDQGSIGWEKFQVKFEYKYNDVYVAVQGLKDIKVVEEYPNRPQSLRFSSPDGIKFTTFKRYRRKLWWKNHQFLEKVILIVIAAIVSVIINSLFYKSKEQTLRLKQEQQDSLIKELVNSVESIEKRLKD